MSAIAMENEPAERRIITVEEYHRMAELGILNEDSRVELIEGEIIEMSPTIGISHNCAVDRLNDRLVRVVGGRACVRVQGSFRLSNITEPQPDLILLKWRADFYAHKFAAGEDTLLVIEVSDSSLRYDRNVKVPLYAKYGIPEVWIVDLENSQLHSFRSLAEGKYTDVSTTAQPGLIPLPGLEELQVDLSGLLEM
jgi:Uma2 family endonuclease